MKSWLSINQSLQLFIHVDQLSVRYTGLSSHAVGSFISFAGTLGTSVAAAIFSCSQTPDSIQHGAADLPCESLSAVPGRQPSYCCPQPRGAHHAGQLA